MPIADMWVLSQGWYGDRLSPDYRPATVEHLQSLLSQVGLVSDFWQLR